MGSCLLILFLLLKCFLFSYDFQQLSLTMIHLHSGNKIYGMLKFEYSFHEKWSKFIPQYLEGEEIVMSFLGC